MRIAWGKILLVAGSSISCIVLVDLILLALHGPVRVVENFYEPDPLCGYRMRPETDFVFANSFRGYAARVHTNSHGLRDDEFPVAKPAGEFRVLLIGDSFTAGLEVDRRETFEAVCESQLARHGPVQVINAGVRGYNLDNIRGFLENEGIHYEPDVVVYLFVENDLTNEIESKPAVTDETRGTVWHGWIGRLSAYSHLLRRVQILRARVALRRDPATGPPDKARISTGLYLMLLDENRGNPAFSRTAERICHLDDICRNHAAHFVLVGAPHREEIDPTVQAWWRRVTRAKGHPDFDGVRDFLASTARQCSLDRMDPIPVFRRERPQVRSFWFHEDGHLNREGHRLLGQLLAAHIEGLESFHLWQQRQSAAKGQVSWQESTGE